MFTFLLVFEDGNRPSWRRSMTVIPEPLRIVAIETELAPELEWQRSDLHRRAGVTRPPAKQV